jgi:hypothetical protein
VVGIVVCAGGILLPTAELIQQIGPGAAIVVLGIASIWASVKILIPKAFDAAVKRSQSREVERARDKEHERALEAGEQTAERQEQMALWTQMVELQTRVIGQNESLLEFVTKKAGDDLQGFAQETQARCAEAKVWWEKAARQMIQNQGEMQLVRMELSRVADAVQSQTERIASLMAYYDALEKRRRE